MARKIEAFSK